MSGLVLVTRPGRGSRLGQVEFSFGLMFGPAPQQGLVCSCAHRAEVWAGLCGKGHSTGSALLAPWIQSL